MNLAGNGPISPTTSTSPVSSPVNSPTEGTITPSASDFPSGIYRNFILKAYTVFSTRLCPTQH